MVGCFMSILPEHQGPEVEGHHEGTCLVLVPYVSDCPYCTVHPHAPSPSVTINYLFILPYEKVF